MRPGPRVAIEIVQHRAAPVALRGRRRRSVKPRPEYRLPGRTQLGDAPRAHAVGQTGLGLALRAQRPERSGQPRKQHEQQQRQRQRQREAARAEHPGCASGQGRTRMGAEQQCRAANPALHQVHGRPQQPLGSQAGRQQQVDPDADDDQAVASRSDLQQLDGTHEDQQRRAGVQSVQGMEHRQHCAGQQRGQADPHRSPRQPRAAVDCRQRPAPRRRRPRRGPDAGSGRGAAARPAGRPRAPVRGPCRCGPIRHPCQSLQAMHGQCPQATLAVRGALVQLQQPFRQPQTEAFARRRRIQDPAG